MQFRLSTLLLLAVVLWSSLAVFGTGGGVGVFIAVVALAICIQKVERVSSDFVLAIIVVIVFLLFIIGFLLPAGQSAREAARRAQCASNLHNIALALLNYETKYRTFPPAFVADKNGRPMHSWRVLILPFLGYDDLFKRYDFDEPWDGPNNRQLLAACPSVFACPDGKNAQSPRSTETSYVAVVGPYAAWLGSKPRKLSELSPTTSTILLVETSNAAIPWTEPRDLSVDLLSFAPSGASVVTASSRHGDYNGFFYSERHFGGINIVFADGHIQFLPPGGLEPSLLSRCFQIGGFNDATSDEIDASSYCPSFGDDRPHVNWTNCLALLVWLVSVGLLLRRAVRNRKADHGPANSSR
jgi:prepilin-type processing-associated H-X9-DG protein